MAITFVQNIGSNSSKTPQSSMSVTAPLGGVSAGDLVVVYAAMQDATARDASSWTCADIKGNSYTNHFTAGNTNTGAGTIFTSKLTTALISSDSITVTWGFTPSIADAMSADDWSGVDDVRDIRGQSAGSSATPTSNNLATTNANDLWLALVNANGPTGDGYTEDSTTLTWTTRTRAGTSGAGVGSNTTLNTASVVTSSTQTEAYDPALGTSRPWLDLAVALKASAASANELIQAAHVSQNGNWYVTQVDSDTPEITGFWGGTIADATTTLDNTWVLFTTAVMQDPEMTGSFDTSDDYAHGDHDPQDPWWEHVYGFPDYQAELAFLFPPSQAEPVETFAAQPAFTEHPDALWYPTEQTSEDLHNPTVFDATTVVADVPVSGSDSLAVALTDSGSVQKLEAIEGLVAAGYSTFQGDVEPLESPQLSTEDYHQSALDLAWFLTTEPKSASDTLAVAITDTASAQAFEGIEQIIAAQPSEYGRLEAETEPQAEIDLHHTSTLDVSWMGIFAPSQQEPDETLAAQPHYGEAFWEATPTDDYTPHAALDTAFIVADVPVAAADNLGIALTDTATVQAFDSVEQLVGSLPVEPYPLDTYIPFEQTVEDWGQVTSLDVSALTPSTPLAPDEVLAAAYTTFENQVEQLEQPQTTIEDYGAPSLEVTAQFGNVEVSASDTLGIALTDTASVAIIEGIEQLIGAQPQLGDIPDILVPVDDHPGNWEAISALDVSALTPAIAGEPIETFAAQPHFGEAYWADAETEEYSQPSTLDLAWFLTTEPKAAPDSLGIAITDTASVEAFSGVVELIASLPTEPYSVDIYTPIVQTVEDWANLTTLDVSALTPDGTPPPPVGTPVRDPQAKLTGALAEAGLIDVEAKAVLTEEEGKAALTEIEGKAILTETEGKADLL